MVVNCKETQYFFDIIIATIKNEPIPNPPELDWDTFVNTVYEQHFVSLVSYALQNSEDVPHQVRKRLNDIKCNEFSRILYVNKEFDEIKGFLINAGIRYMPLKGSIIKKYYPKESFRQLSDIDILCDYEFSHVICDMMAERGYEKTSDGGNTDDFSKEPYYTFEFHHDLFKDVYGFCPDFNFVWEHASINGENEYEYSMSSEDVYLHSIAHMYKHFILGGFGIKFIIDTYVLLESNESTWNRQYIDEKLEQMNILDFERHIVDVTYAFFNHHLSDEQEQFFQKAFRYGAFCNDPAKSNVEEIIKLYQKKEDGSYIKYIFRRVFPPVNSLKSIYPVLVEKTYLIPFYYLKRLLSKIITGPRKVFREMSYFINSKNRK